MTAADQRMSRERILVEAARLFGAQGYHGISMREIAEAVGVSKAGLYYHFRDKQELFLAILTTNLDELDRLIAVAAQQGPPLRAQLACLVRALVERAPEQRAIMRLASQEIAHLDAAAQATFGRHYHERFIGQVEGLLQAGVTRGELRVLDVHLTTWLLLGMVHPLLYLAQEQAFGARDDVVEQVLDLFLRGAQAGGVGL